MFEIICLSVLPAFYIFFSPKLFKIGPVGIILKLFCFPFVLFGLAFLWCSVTAMINGHP